MKKISILSSFLIILVTISFSIASKENSFKFDDIEGIQVYHFKEKNYYMYSTHQYKDDTLYLTINAFFSNKVNISDDGLWFGVGLGTPGMHGSDMVICTYKQSREKQFACEDYFSEGHSIMQDTKLGGTNDVELIKGEVLEDLEHNKWQPYTKHFVFEVKKKLNLADHYDWNGLPNIMTSKAYIISAFGSLYQNEDLMYHTDYNSQKIKDGEGIMKTDL